MQKREWASAAMVLRQKQKQLEHALSTGEAANLAKAFQLEVGVIFGTAGKM